MLAPEMQPIRQLKHTQNKLLEKITKDIKLQICLIPDTTFSLLNAKRFVLIGNLSGGCVEIKLQIYSLFYQAEM